MNRSQIYGHLAAIFCILVWGLTFISTKILLASFTPTEILAFRFFIGWIILWVLSPRMISAAGYRCHIFLAAAGLTGITLYFLLENMALAFSLASNVGIIVTLSPFFTAILAWIFLSREKPSRNFFIGFLLALLGISLIFFNGLNFQSSPLGDTLALFAAFSWAIFSILLRKLADYKLDSLAATRGMFFWGLIFMTPLILSGNFSFQIEKIINPGNLLNLLFLGVLASALCFAAWTLAVRNLGAIKTTAYIYLIPVITVLAAAIILREHLTFYVASGMVLTLMGLLFAEIKPGSIKSALSCLRR